MSKFKDSSVPKSNPINLRHFILDAGSDFICTPHLGVSKADFLFAGERSKY